MHKKMHMHKMIPKNDTQKGKNDTQKLWPIDNVANVIKHIQQK